MVLNLVKMQSTRDYLISVNGRRQAEIKARQEPSFQPNEVWLNIFTKRLAKIDFNCNNHIPQLGALAARNPDPHPDLADLCLIRMSELFPGHSIITVDGQDFRRISGFTDATGGR